MPIKFFIIAILFLIATPVLAMERTSSLTGETYEILTDYKKNPTATVTLKVDDFPSWQDCQDGKVTENCSRADAWRIEDWQLWQDCKAGKDISKEIASMNCSQNTYEEYLDLRMKEKKEAIVANEESDKKSKAKQDIDSYQATPVAVSLAGGEIKIGDKIALPSFAGVGRKVTSLPPGETIGVALENFNENSPKSSDGVGVIMVFIDLNNTYLAISEAPLSADSLAVQDDSTQNFASLAVTEAATFYGAVTVYGETNFIGKVVFNKEVEFKGHITVDKDTAGTVKILTSNTSTEVSFATEYDFAPKIYLTPEANPQSFFWVNERTVSGFRINLANPAPVDIEFNWLAMAVKEDATAATENPTPEPPADLPAENPEMPPIAAEPPVDLSQSLGQLDATNNQVAANPQNIIAPAAEPPVPTVAGATESALPPTPPIEPTAIESPATELTPVETSAEQTPAEPNSTPTIEPSTTASTNP